MWKRISILVLEFIAALAGNLISGWIQQDVWSNLFTPARLVGTAVGVGLMILVVAWLDREPIKARDLLLSIGYRSRAKRGNDEVRLLGRYERIAKERMQSSFVSMVLWNCRWTWDWSDDLEPTNIQGHCLGRKGLRELIDRKFDCNYPVRGAIIKHSGKQIAGINDVGIVCIRGKSPHHESLRAVFQDVRISGMASPDEVNNAIETEVKKAIINERNLKITREIRKLRLQPWR